MIRLHLGTLTAAQSALRDRMVTRLGGPAAPRVTSDGLPEPALALRLLSPEVGHAMEEFIAALDELSLSAQCREVAILATAHAMRSDYEVAHHERSAAAKGLTADQLGAIRAGDAQRLSEPGLSATLTLALRLLVPGRIDDSEFEAASRVLGEAGVFEVATLVGFYQLVAHQLAAFKAV